MAVFAEMPDELARSAAQSAARARQKSAPSDKRLSLKNK
jgi:hypothetical protein